MDRFKLVMQNGGFQERRNKLIFRVDELLEITHQLSNCLFGRRHVACGIDASAAKPVLTSSKLSRGFVLSAYAVH